MIGFATKTVIVWMMWLVMASPALADVGAFLAQVVAAHGGGVTPTAIHARGMTQSVRRGSGPVERWWQAPDRFRSDIDYPDAPESRVLRGNEAWQQGEPASAALYGAMVLQAARMALPWRLQQNAQRLIDNGTQQNSAGKLVRVLEWPVQDGIKLIVEIDPETLLILRSRGILAINNASMEFATDYIDYRTVDGRRVAMVEQHYVMGQFVGATTFDIVEFPSLLPAPTFDPTPTAAGLSAGVSGTPNSAQRPLNSGDRFSRKAARPSA